MNEKEGLKFEIQEWNKIMLSGVGIGVAGFALILLTQGACFVLSPAFALTGVAEANLVTFSNALGAALIWAGASLSTTLIFIPFSIIPRLKLRKQVGPMEVNDE